MFKTILILSAIFASLQTFAHGEDVPGPHGGYIQMPANFHTEVVPDKNGKSFKVYLTDLQFKNPLTKNSEVKAQLGDQNILCSVKKDYFLCSGAKNLKSGTLVIKATRDGVVAQTEATYDLPLKSFKQTMHH